jgi:GNAT superfamily N-acetyltransferase
VQQALARNNRPVPEIVQASPQDVPDWVRIVRACAPYYLCSEASERYERWVDPSSVQRVVALLDGVVVGIARLNPEGSASCLVMVDPHYRRLGVGTALWNWHLTQLDQAEVTEARVIVEPDSRIVADQVGFDVDREYTMSSVDPRTVVPPQVPADFEVLPTDKLDVVDIWRVHQMVAGDDPSGLTQPVTLMAYRNELRDPRYRLDLGRALVRAGSLRQVVAFSLVLTVGNKMNSAMTGVHPEFRRRGLGFLVKSYTLQAAGAAGITLALTGNDSANVPMLAINTKVGYQPYLSCYGALWKREEGVHCEGHHDLGPG